jgi:inner membrane protein
MGEAFAGNTVGKKAMLWGILAQSIPDIDFLASLWLNTADNLLAHRGFTHSILFALLISPVFALLAERWHRPHDISYTRWLLFLSSVIGVHIFIDAFNNYGVGWFEPFSHYRVSFNIIFVADPFFSAAPAIAFIMLLLLRIKNSGRKFWWRFGLGISFLYLGYCTINKIYINRKVKQLLVRQQIPYKRFITTPAPLQNWLWFIAAGNDSGYYTGYISVFDRNKNTKLHYFPRNDTLLSIVKNKSDVTKLIRFSQQFYTLEQHADTILFNDLRFGQIIGWQNPGERFAFYYYLQPQMNNTLVVQRGRFAKWDEQSLQSLLRRIRGN